MEVCKVCGGSYKRITSSHLKTHNMTIEEYLQLYKKEEYKERKVIQFLMNNYVNISNRYKFVIYLVNDKSAKTVKIDKDSKRKFPLGQNDIKKHLRAMTAIGIYTSTLNSKLIAFDIDIDSKAEKEYQSINNCLEVLETLVEKLNIYGVSEENILCSFSGSKGYHVDIFLDDAISVDIAKQFQELVTMDVMSDVAVDVKKGVVIEHRGTNGQAYKLPLGYHQKTRNKCYICNEYGVEQDDLFCLTKKNINSSVIKQAVLLNYNLEDSYIFNKADDVLSSVQLLDIHISENENRRKKIEKLLDGRTKITKSYIQSNVRDNSRSFLIYEVSLYLKFVMNQSEEQALTILENWVKNCWDESLIDKECKEHIKSNVKSVYKRAKYFDNATKVFNITKQHMQEVISIDVKHKQKNLALRKLYFILMVHSNYFASINGEFKMAYSVMERMGAIKNNRSALKKQLEELEKLGKIEIVANSVKKSAYEKDKVYESNSYKLTNSVIVEPDTNVVGIRHCKGEYNCENCMLVCSSTVLPRKQTTSFISLKEYKQYKDSCPYNKLVE